MTGLRDTGYGTGSTPLGGDADSPLVQVLLAGGGYVVRDPEFVALVQNVVRCHGCDRLRVKHPDGHDAMCPWCSSNSASFVNANPLEFEEPTS